MHEASTHEFNCFVTLTYDEEHLPRDRSLDKSHFQKFMKRLRKTYDHIPIRFYHCGEYGDPANGRRPHYHACLFGIQFEDRIGYRKTDQDHILYRSASLQRIWGKGFCTVGDLTFESAAYVARYVTKKVSGDKAQEHYGDLTPEYATMSRRPGIGHSWYLKNGADVFPDDFVVMNGARCKPPKYYLRLLEQEDPFLDETQEEYLLDTIKQRREAQAKARVFDNTPERLAVREEVQLRRAQLLKRGLEND